ncbi:putative negative regulator of the PHO system [Cladorrhinum sp. PSN332]|nr:putative negative regulator of the PHO system [Cladorrhinum sp. PSN332]
MNGDVNNGLAEYSNGVDAVRDPNNDDNSDFDLLARSERTASPSELAETRGTGPGFDAMFGRGLPPLPEIRIGIENGISKPLSYTNSDVPTERAERLTISDRGESLYLEISANEPNRHQQQQQLGHGTAVGEDDGDDASTLLKRLFLLRCRSKTEDGAYFFPRGSVEALIKEKVVSQMIKEEQHKLKNALKRPITDSMIAQYARTVCQSGYRKMFAILVMLERAWEIALFVEDKLSDGDLPLLAYSVGSSGRLVEMRRKDSPNQRLACCQNWSPRTHEEFDKEQWGLISPFFARGKLRRAHFYELSKKDILPWTKEDSKVHQGGYASISRIQIHPNHHNFERNMLSDGTFAVKHFTANRSHTSSPIGTVVPDHSYGSIQPGLPPPASSSATSVSPQELKKEFECEIEILNRFSGDDHPHLISLLAAYRHGNEYCLLFRWAECDLKAFWEKTKPGSALDKSNLLWMVEQCRGIAHGLQRIHFYQTTDTRTKDNLGGKIFGRHGDIKPENILIFRNQRNQEGRGTLVITDFGLSKFHHDGTKTYFSAREVPATLTYQPPECDMEDCKISRSFDIWSFGCVLLEFVTWQLGGWEYVQEFVQFRKALNILLFGWKTDHFYEIVRHGNKDGLKDGFVLVRVKIEIHEFVNRLHAHKHCSETFHELLDFIMEKMLIIESVNLGQRAPCSEVYLKLNDLYNRLIKSDYVVKAKPRGMVKAGPPEAVEMPLNLEGVRIMKSR